MCRDDTEDDVVFSENGDGVLRVSLDSFQTILYFFIRIDEGITGFRNIFKLCISSCDNQFFQIDGTVIGAVLMHDIDFRDVIMLGSLLNQGFHGIRDV